MDSALHASLCGRRMKIPQTHTPEAVKPEAFVPSCYYVFPVTALTQERKFLYSLINILRMTLLFAKMAAGGVAIV